MTSGSASKTGRQRLAEERARQAKAAERRSAMIRYGSVLAVLVVIVGIGIAIQAARTSSPANAGNATPAHVSSKGGVVVGSGPVKVTLYEDFQCPVCQAFQADSGPALEQLRNEGKISIEYRMLSFLDRASSTQYSSRSLNAAACVVNSDPSAFEKFHDLLYTKQPAEGSAGLPNTELVSLAKQAGAGDLSSCIDSQKYFSWGAKVTDQASKDGVNATPTVMVNGKALTDRSKAAVVAAIDAASKG